MSTDFSGTRRLDVRREADVLVADEDGMIVLTPEQADTAQGTP